MRDLRPAQGGTTGMATMPRGRPVPVFRLPLRRDRTHMEAGDDECSLHPAWRDLQKQGLRKAMRPLRPCQQARSNVTPDLVCGGRKLVRLPSLSRLGLVVLGFLASCAEAGLVSHQRMPDRAGGGEAASATSAPSVIWYEGQRVPGGADSTCSGRSQKVWFRVEGGLVEMRSSRHRGLAASKPMLAGTVSPDGEMALRSVGAARSAVGRIQGDHLTASDVPDLMVLGRTRGTCGFRYEATRR